MQTKKSPTINTKIKEFKPTMFKVILLNDNVTTMDFVVAILMEIFGKNQSEAVKIMLQIHQSGSGVCGIYTKDIAQTKQTQVLSAAKAYNFPLKCIIKEE